jgi:hypothetical protein
MDGSPLSLQQSALFGVLDGATRVDAMRDEDRSEGAAVAGRGDGEPAAGGRGGGAPGGVSSKRAGGLRSTAVVLAAALLLAACTTPPVGPSVATPAAAPDGVPATGNPQPRPIPLASSTCPTPAFPDDLRRSSVGGLTRVSGEVQPDGSVLSVVVGPIRLFVGEAVEQRQPFRPELR